MRPATGIDVDVLAGVTPPYYRDSAVHDYSRFDTETLSGTMLPNGRSTIFADELVRQTAHNR